MSVPRRTLRHQHIALAIAAALASTHASAADQPAPQGNAVERLHKVVVAGQKTQSAGLRSLSRKSIFRSAFGDKVLDRQQLKSAGPVGGAAQALTFAPGVSISG